MFNKVATAKTKYGRITQQQISNVSHETKNCEFSRKTKKPYERFTQNKETLRTFHAKQKPANVSHETAIT